MKQFGTDYGGFYYPEELDGLDKNSIIYCIGAGEDISHDIAIANKLNSKVYIIDKMKNNMTKIFVYEHEKKIIGTVKLLIETKFIFNISYVGHIEDICVYKEYRNKI